MTDLTVIIPTYQRQVETEKAVESVVAQDYDCDLIVVDDCSEPGFELPVGLNNNCISIIRHRENFGPAAARNSGIKVAKTRFVSFLDSDDYLLPGTLLKRLETAAALDDETALVGCSWLDVRGDSDSVVRAPRKAVTPDDYFGGSWFAPGSAVIFPRVVFERIGGFDRRLRRLEDAEWTMRLGQGGGHYVHDDCVGVAIQHNADKNRQEIADASLLITGMIRKQLSEQRISASQFRRMMAYLALERSVAEKRDGRLFSAMAEFARSQFNNPRLAMHTSPGWLYREPGTNPLS